MDQVERKLDDWLDERDRLDERLSVRDVNTQRVSEAETEKEVSAMLQGYDLGLSDRDDERSPAKLELVSEFRHTHRSPPAHHSPPHHPHPHPPPPPLAMDISSVRFRPVPVMAQAVMTSIHGHPKPNLPEMGKINN